MHSPASTIDRHQHEPMQDGTYRFDRRTSPRWSGDGSATALIVGGESFGTIYGLEALDFGYHGMGAQTDRPIAPGSVVTVGFSAMAQGARRGVVTRCVPVGQGYRLGLRFEGRLAA